MKTPMPPPPLAELLEAAERAQRLGKVLTSLPGQPPRYLHWDEMRYRKPPEDLTVEEWWLKTKLGRSAMYRSLPLTDQDGRPFKYAIPDEVLRSVENISRHASGRRTAAEAVANPATRDRYLVSSLIEEAITSSQLEGASTTRAVAKDMLRSGRPPTDRSERMIVNNYMAMQRIGELQGSPLTTEVLLELHRIITDGTLDDPDTVGRFQSKNEERVGVYAEHEQLLYKPPPAEEIPRRIEELLSFANGDSGAEYTPPVLRAIAVHFMIGYIHPFEDGNGRTARALFYWAMLREGFWLTEFLSISRILKKAPAKYVMSYLLTETDDSDLTYFFIYHLGVVERAMAELDDYLQRKMGEVRALQKSLRASAGAFNHRQLALLQHATTEPGLTFTLKAHARSHNASHETARLDLLDLERKGLFRKHRVSREYVFVPVPDLADKLIERQA